MNFLLDTGATQIAVPLAVAQSAGLTEGDIQLVQTAGGTTRVRDTLVDSIAIGPLRFSNYGVLLSRPWRGRSAFRNERAETIGYPST